MDTKYELLRECKDQADFESANPLEGSKIESSPPCNEERTRIALSTRTALSWLAHAILILTSTTLFVLSMRDQHKGCECSTASSPILGEHWNTHTFSQRFNGTFKLPSTYKGPPNEAVDEAWEKITPRTCGLSTMHIERHTNRGPVHLIRITELEFQGINASRHAAEIPDAEGGRIAIFEAFHMIHCLKDLWQNTYPEYYSDMHAYSQAHPEEWHEHVDHCTDMIRQKLMCDADASLITYNWLKNHYYPHPNFNVQHQCRDYDALLQVAQERKVEGSFLRPDRKAVVEFEEAPFDPEADA